MATAPKTGPSESDITELFYRHMGEGSEVGFENAIAEALARWGCQPAPLAEGGVVEPSDEELLRLMPERWTAPAHAAAAIQAGALSYARVVWAAAAAAHQIQPAPLAEGTGQVDPIRAALERLVEAAERVADVDPIAALGLAAALADLDAAIAAELERRP